MADGELKIPRKVDPKKPETGKPNLEGIQNWNFKLLKILLTKELANRLQPG